MKRQFQSGFRITTILLASTILGMGQTVSPTQQQAPTMPPPGAVNYVEGQVSINGQELSGQNLRSTVLAPNETIDTGHGFAEMLLTPGAFLRLGHDSSVRLGKAGLAEVRFSVLRGSALVEVADLVKGSRISIDFGSSTAQIEDKGLYSFAFEEHSVKVLDGKLKVIEGDRDASLHKGDLVLLASDQPLKKRDFNRKGTEAEQLFVWSRVRSQVEEAANVNLANSLVSSGGWNGPGWYWDPYWSFYSFVPGYGFLGGPFGYGFYSPFAFGGGYYGRGFYGRGYYGYGLRGRAYYGHSGGYYRGGNAFHRGAIHSGMAGAHATGGIRGGGGRR